MQGFWLLEPVPVDDIDRLEAYNIVLEQTLGADRCHNIDRIMRLPGTINLPNRKKRLAGREPALASVVEAHWDRRYRLEDFQPATASDAPNENPGKANRHDTEAPPSEVDIDALPVHADQEPDPRGSRSRALLPISV
jgi:hypothetical protein